MRDFKAELLKNPLRHIIKNIVDKEGVEIASYIVTTFIGKEEFGLNFLNVSKTEGFRGLVD